MNCSKAQRLVDPLVDGELDVVTTVDLEEHFEACPECSWLHESRRAVRAAMREEFLEFRAPEGLEARVRTAVRRDATGGSRQNAGPSVAAPVAFLRPRAASRSWTTAVAASLLVAAIAAGVVWRTTRLSPGDLIAREAVASHVRSLMADHLMDVPSTDQHTVKPWFDGKLDFAPPVVDLADNDFKLVGGRLDYVADEPVAALVYQRRLHILNLFVCPSRDAAPERAESYKGYNVVRWTGGGMDFCAVSDINAAELREFADDIRARTEAPKGS